MRTALALAGFFGMTAVALGAYGAHGLSRSVDAAHQAYWQTAVHYHMVHALALLGTAAAGQLIPRRLRAAIAGLFCAGILLFSGSLYAMTFLSLPLPAHLGLVTPAGGLCLMGGWLLLAVAALRRR